MSKTTKNEKQTTATAMLKPESYVYPISLKVI